MQLKEINKWWQKGIDKERVRLSNAPKAPKGDRFATITQFSNFAPEPQQGKSGARRHR